jgi:hypothetical protein
MRRKAGLFAITVLAVMMIAGVAVAGGHLAPSATNTENVYWFADGSDAGGTSNLTRTDGMVLAVVEAEGLTPGNAYTLWWVVFNDPGDCSAPGCGEDDIFTEAGDFNWDQIEAAEIGIGNASGNIAKADGSIEFGARLAQNDDSGAHQVALPAGGSGDAYLEYGCTPGCVDVQFAVHLP